MPPKKDLKGNHDADILEQLRVLSKKVDSIDAKQDQISKLVKEVQRLREDNAKKDEKITKLENRVNQLEQYTRRDDVIITGLRIRHKSYARATDES